MTVIGGNREDEFISSLLLPSSLGAPPGPATLPDATQDTPGRERRTWARCAVRPARVGRAPQRPARAELVNAASIIESAFRGLLIGLPALAVVTRLTRIRAGRAVALMQDATPVVLALAWVGLVISVLQGAWLTAALAALLAASSRVHAPLAHTERSLPPSDALTSGADTTSDKSMGSAMALKTRSKPDPDGIG